jgi:hypothetical protein
MDCFNLEIFGFTLEEIRKALADSQFIIFDEPVGTMPIKYIDGFYLLFNKFGNVVFCGFRFEASCNI